jgi:hypothetical protein
LGVFASHPNTLVNKYYAECFCSHNLVQSYWWTYGSGGQNCHLSIPWRKK